jgi:hypothetical protein
MGTQKRMKLDLLIFEAREVMPNAEPVPIEKLEIGQTYFFSAIFR